MRDRYDHDPLVQNELYLAGERVPAGTYVRVGSSREIFLEDEDFLPASLDGCVACYMRVRPSWSQQQRPFGGRS